MAAPPPYTAGKMQTVLLSALAMLAFAANSILCRLALGAGHIDATSYATIRVLSGALVLAAIVVARDRGISLRDVNGWSAFALYVYMVCFAFAYVSLATGTGALILFGAVQLTMFSASLKAGDPFPLLSWFGLGLAAAGLVYLVSPGVEAPDAAGALTMAVAGIAWGLYSLIGRGAADATRATAWNFVLAVPLALVTSAVFAGSATADVAGVTLAVASGAMASGIGYVIWYAALKGLAASDAATLQLSVPVIAAIGGVVLLAEPVTMRLVIASIATLGGVAIVLRRGTQGR